ncbi:MAG: fumarate hydratase, partial [bacterium]
PTGLSTLQLRNHIHDAIAEATSKSYLRPNAVDSLTGENSGNNLGKDFPTIHFEEWEKDDLRIDLLLKGGGCETVGAQYRLPYAPLQAGRDITGVKKVVLDAVYQAQGKGCAPGILGVGIGGDRGTSYVLSKQQLFRKLDDQNENETLRAAEEELLEKGNRLQIGPMGFGGKTTLLGVKMDWMHRLPACFFVSISYMCWADRRKSMVLKNDKIEIN